MAHQPLFGQPVEVDIDALRSDVASLLSDFSLDPSGEQEHAGDDGVSMAHKAGPEGTTALKLLFSNAHAGIVIGRAGCNRLEASPARDGLNDQSPWISPMHRLVSHMHHLVSHMHRLVSHMAHFRPSEHLSNFCLSGT